MSSGRATFAAALLALGLCASTGARAWGAEGHQLIAEVAQTRLGPPAAAEVARLLALEPGSTLASISTWADETRNRTTAPWHYVNFPRDANCRFDDARDCAGGACVVDAIGRQVAILRSDAPDAQRLTALKFVVHLVADVHQPLHAAFGDDRGGNAYQVQAWGRGTNLHAVWDAAIIKNWPGGRAALEGALSAEVEREAAAAVGVGDPKVWAEESCQVASRAGFYPSGHVLLDSYPGQWAPVLVQRMAAAALRTAQVLNDSLARP